MRILPISQGMIAVQTEREGPVHLKPKTPTSKRMDCSAARKTENVKCNVAFGITVPNSTSKTKLVFKDRVVAMVQGYENRRTAAKET